MKEQFVAQFKIFGMAIYSPLSWGVVMEDNFVIHQVGSSSIHDETDPINGHNTVL